MRAKHGQSNGSKERPKYNRCKLEKRRKQDMLCIQKVGPYSQKLLGKAQEEDSRNTAGASKRKWRTVSSQLASNNLYSVLHPEKLGNTINITNTTERVRDVRHTLWPLSCQTAV